jgi:hypothetical protein
LHADNSHDEEEETVDQCRENVDDIEQPKVVERLTGFGFNDGDPKWL